MRPAGSVASALDLVVIGGGVAGLMIALEAARRGLTPALVERERIGCGATKSWFRIVHGGLRYLQSLDLWRLRVSMAERRFFLSTFPDLVEPMPFLMPLDGGGPRHPAALAAAFATEAMLTADRNRGVPAERRIPPGRVLRPDETRAMFPDVRAGGLLGGALWQDGLAREDGALVAEIARWARAAGAVLHEGLEARDLLVDDGRVTGVSATPRGGGGRTDLPAPVVINAAGPCAAALARRLDAGAPSLFAPLMAFNLLLDRPPPAEVGLALTPPASRGPAIFLYPLDGLTFAGTWYGAPSGDPHAPVPCERDVEAFLGAVDAAVPSLRVRRADVLGVLAGLQPAARAGSLAARHRDVVHDHGAAGGPRGLYSVAAVKFTTARFLAETVLRLACRRAGSPLPPPLPGTARPAPATGANESIPPPTVPPRHAGAGLIERRGG